MLPLTRFHKETKQPASKLVFLILALRNDVWRWSTFVPPTKIPPRAPFGPSLVFAAGIPFSLIALVLQKSAAVRREILHDVSKSVMSQRESGEKHTFSSCVSSDILSTAQALCFWELCLEAEENGTETSVSGVEQTPLLLREGVCKGDVVESKSLSMMT